MENRQPGPNMYHGKHIPLRTCIGCRRKKARSELVRLALDESGWICIDAHQRMPGRGIYLCPEEGCLRHAVQKQLFSRHLKTTVRVNAEQLFKDMQSCLITKK
ncbi:MAG: YlxR family protein [Calditrichaeota bacterium]|nr:MAG: YlxR family protein [Calditrichota bacterium]